MNIKDLDPNSYTVIEEQPQKKLNIKDLAPDSYTEVEDFQDKLARQREKDKELYAQTQENPIMSGIRGASDTLSFGYDDELAAGLSAVGSKLTGDDRPIGDIYSADQAALEAVKERAAEDNPISTLAGQIVAAAATMKPSAALAGKIGSGVARLGAGAKSAKALGLAGAAAAEGGLYGSGTAGQGERLKGAATGAATGAAVSGAMSGLGKLAQKAPDFIPAARSGNTIGNKVAATISPRRLLPGTTKQNLLDYLSNPELRKKASVTDVSNEVSKLSSTLGDEMAASKKAVQDIYGELEDKAVGEISGAPGDVLDSALQTIKNNPKDMFSAKVKSAIKTAKSIAEGKSTKTAGQPDGVRLLEARRFLDKGVGDRKTLSKLDNELIDEARGELQSVLRQSEPMRQADDLYSEFKKVRKGVEDKVFSGPKGAKELDPEKLRRALTTTTLKGEAFEESLNTYDQFIKSNPRLANSPEVQTAKASLDKLKEVIDVGQLEYKLSKSGGPTAEAAFLVAQGLGSSVLGPGAFIGLPLMNPTVWSAIVDNVSPTAQALMKNIEKAAPIIKSAAVREIVKQEQRKD